MKVEHISAQAETLLGSLEKYTIVVVTEPLGQKLENQINEECRSKKVKNIVSYCKGLVARLFVDLGEEFLVVDRDGEELPEIMVQSISQEKEAVVELTQNNKQPLVEGEMVSVDQVVGMEGVNKKVFKVLKQLSLNKYHLDCDTSSMAEYQRGGVLKALKTQVKVNNRSLAHCHETPLS